MLPQPGRPPSMCLRHHAWVACTSSLPVSTLLGQVESPTAVGTMLANPPAAGSPPSSPEKYRSSSVGSAQKSCNYRTKGLDPKFKKSDNLQVFHDRIWSHFLDHGLDMVTYVPDPASATEMISCILQHECLSTNDVTRSIVPQLQFYDAYDHANDRDAVKYLLESLDNELLSELRSMKTGRRLLPSCLRLLDSHPNKHVH